MNLHLKILSLYILNKRAACGQVHHQQNAVPVEGRQLAQDLNFDDKKNEREKTIFY